MLTNNGLFSIASDFPVKIGPVNRQRTLTEGDDSVQMTSSLRQLVLQHRQMIFSMQISSRSKLASARRPAVRTVPSPLVRLP